MNVLIVAGQEDFHAKAVEYALREKGVIAHYLASDNFTQNSVMSVRLGTGAAGAGLYSDEQYLDLRSVDTVWNRRPYEPIQIGPVVEEDEPFVRRQALAAREGAYRLLAAARWVNPFESVPRAENKIYQLACAEKLGFRIPETLVSNDPDDVRAFLRSNIDCIYKPLHGHVWQESGRRRATYTAVVSEQVLPADALLRATPGIYQARVEHGYEVRAQFFGHQCAAIKIDVTSDGGTDWRLAQGTIERCDPACLPEGLQARCHALMGELGLVAAGFDFLVTQEGQWIFLELNQAGQFLFLEDWCPQLPMLDMFCTFLGDPSPHWRYMPSHRICRFSDFTEAFRTRIVRMA